MVLKPVHAAQSRGVCADIEAITHAALGLGIGGRYNQRLQPSPRGVHASQTHDRPVFVAVAWRCKCPGKPAAAPWSRTGGSTRRTVQQFMLLLALMEAAIECCCLR